jgi:hypothetical protein
MSETPPAAPTQPQAWDVPPKKQGVGGLQIAAMIAVVALTWAAAACAGSLIAFQGMVSETPRLMNSLMGDTLAFVVRDYMTYMYYGDGPGAALLFSSDSGVSEADLQQTLDDAYYLFDGYIDIEVTEVEGLPDDYFDNPDESALEGKPVTLRGTIEYEDGTTGEFTAVVINEFDSWVIQSIDISVPQEKIDAYEGEE